LGGGSRKGRSWRLSVALGAGGAKIAREVRQVCMKQEKRKGKMQKRRLDAKGLGQARRLAKVEKRSD